MEELSFEEYRKLISNVNPEEGNCPVRRALDLFSGKWNLRVLYELTKTDSMRFGGLKKQIGGITNTMLSSTLKDLEEKEFVVRAQYNEIPPRVEYALSEAGRDLYPIFIEIAKWSGKYAPDPDEP